MTPKVVTICGSMRFWTQMLAVAAEETTAGRIVLAPFLVFGPGEQDSDDKKRLDELHLRKIDMCDHIILVTNQDGYMGDSTRRELAYATEREKFRGVQDIREFWVDSGVYGAAK